MNKHTYSHIIIANTNELFLEEVSLLPQDSQEHLLEEYVYAANRAIFYESDNKVIILPRPFDSKLRQKYTQQIGYKNVIYWSPNNETPSICFAILQDADLLRNIKEVITHNPHIIITTYSYTQEFCTLIEHLAEEGLTFQLDNQPTHLNIIRELNSKAGFRRVASQIEAETKEKIIPSGIIVETKEEVIAHIQHYLQQQKPFVVKSNYGASGRGVILSENIPTEKTLHSFLERAEFDKMWENSSLIIEEKITAPILQSPGSELIITDNSITYTYWFVQTLTDKGEFLGALLGKEYLSDKVQKSLQHQSLLIAKAYQKKGFRGFLGLDFMVDDKENVYAIETNSRRTGGTHAYDTLKFMFGNEWIEKVHCYSCDCWEFSADVPNSEVLIEKLSPLAYQNGKGLIILNFSAELKMIGFFLIASHKAEIDSYIQKLSELLS